MRVNLLYLWHYIFANTMKNSILFTIALLLSSCFFTAHTSYAAKMKNKKQLNKIDKNTLCLNEDQLLIINKIIRKIQSDRSKKNNNNQAKKPSVKKYSAINKDNIYDLYIDKEKYTIPEKYLYDIYDKGIGVYASKDHYFFKKKSSF